MQIRPPSASTERDGYSPLDRYPIRRDQKAEHETGQQAAQMGGCAHLRSRNVEEDLNGDDEENVEKTLPSLPDLTMPKKKTSPRADDSHDATGRADELSRAHDFYQRERDDAGSRSESRN